MTKEQILDKSENLPEHFITVRDITRREFALMAMEEYAKQEAIAFSNFKNDYQHIEAMNVRHYNNERYGSPVGISWIGASDDIIWEAYKNGEQLKRWFEKD